MATREDDPKRRPDQQDERNRKERESVTGNRTELRRPKDEKTSTGAGTGTTAGRP